MRALLQGKIVLALPMSALALLIVSAVGGQIESDSNTTTLPVKAATLLGLKCLGCHNPDKKAGGIDLTSRLSALRANAFVPDEPDKSRMTRAVSSGKMPPDGRLPDAEVSLLRRWIAGGAVYPRVRLEAIKPTDKPLWSFQPVKVPVIPTSRFDSLSANPIDRFLFSAIQKKGLHPSPPAGRLALLRRVTIDLTGLPPTNEEIDAFLNDKRPDAYERVVDRLLASPAYGEQWGRHWLDVVRYGESNGYEQNHLRRNAWPYRDYVIRAFNEDKPYNQFVTEQIAGDVVGRGDPDVEVATGFLVAGIHDTVPTPVEEATRQQRANDLDDMVSTTGAAFLGLTINCARCHDHKFDPIPTRDYYRLSAVFAGVRHGERALAMRPQTPDKLAEMNRLLAAILTQSNQLQALETIAENRLEGPTPKKRPAVDPQHNVDAFPPVLARFVRFTVLATNDGSPPCLDELQIFVPDSEVNLALASGGARATASSLLPGYAIHQIAHLNDGITGNSHSWISNEPGGGWAQIELAKPAVIGSIEWERDTEGAFRDRLVTAYRVDVSEDGVVWKQVANGEDRHKMRAELTTEVLQQAMTAVERTRYDQIAADLASLRQQVAAQRPAPSVYCGQFTASDPTFVLKGGDVMRRDEPVTPGALSKIATLPSDLGSIRSLAVQDQNGAPGRHSDNDQANPLKQVKGIDVQPAAPGVASVNPRLALAQWICDPRNPLTARVFVNRVWEHHFGRGIVDSPSDFGNIGSAPSHPELLDWLANDFMTHGWRLKRLHRLLVTSYAYRQASAVNPDGEAKDADNRLVWRMPLRRMEAEAVRDAVLVTSGKLDRTMGGPGFQLFTYSVVNVAIYGPREDQGPDTWRRSVYQVPARGIRDDLLGNFDCPDSSERTPRRTNTTTALQALSMLNGRFISDQAGFFAARIQKRSDQRDSEIRAAFQLAFGRAPSEAETRAATLIVSRYGLSTLCRALLNANEFLYY